jgi:hypothetical protein
MEDPTRPIVQLRPQGNHKYSRSTTILVLLYIIKSPTYPLKAETQSPSSEIRFSVPFTVSAVSWHRNIQTRGKLISNFSNPAGLVFLPQIKKCFITSHYLIETKFDLANWNIKIGQVLSQLKNYIQNPFIDSSIDLANYRYRRSPNSPSSSKNPRLPKTSKTQAFTFASLQKSIVHFENYAVPYLFNGFLTLFQNAKPTFRPFPFSPYEIVRVDHDPDSLPFLDRTNRRAYIEISDPLDENVWNLYYSTLTRLNEPNNELVLDGTTIVYNSSLNPFNDQLLQLEHTLDILNELLEDAAATLQDLQRHILPIYGHDYDDFSRIVDDILRAQHSPLFNSKQMLNYLRTHKHTFILRDDCVSAVPTATCSMYIVTYLPIISTQHCYQQYEVQTFPVIKPGLITDDWVQIELSEKHFLLNDHIVKIIDLDHYHCFENDNNLLELCVTKKKRIQSPSRCFEKILSAKSLQETLKSCSYNKLSQITDQATFLDSDSLAYVNPNPGTIISRCPGQEQETSHLQYNGIIHMDPTCAYEMINGPLTPEDSYHPFLTITNLAESSLVILHDPDSREIITHHIQEYAVYYISGLASSVGLLVSFFIVYCSYGRYIPCCNICSKRQGRNTRPNSSHAPTRPSAPILPQIEPTYPDIRNQLQRLVRNQLATTVI